MTKILISGHVLKSDSNGWTYGKPRTYFNPEKGKDEEQIKDPRYSSSLEFALVGLLEMVTRDAAAKSIQELLDEVRSFKKEVRRFLEG